MLATALRWLRAEQPSIYLIVGDNGYAEAIGPFASPAEAVEFDVDVVDTLFCNPVVDVRRAISPEAWTAREIAPLQAVSS